jgi:hypothetical protein
MERTGTQPAAVPGATQPRRVRFGKALRVVLWITAIQVALQPVFAGMHLDGVPNAGLWHLINGSLLELVTVFALLIVSILAWRPGRAPGRVAVAGILVFVIIWVQSALGHTGVLSVHVPLGVATLVLLVWLLVATRDLEPVPRRK